MSEFFRVLLRVKGPRRPSTGALSPIYTQPRYQLCRPWTGPRLGLLTGMRLPQCDPLCLPIHETNTQSNIHNRRLMQHRARTLPWDGSHT